MAIDGFIDDVRGESDEYSAWLDRLPVEGPDVPFPDAEDLPDALLDLAVPHADVNELLAVHRAAGPTLAALRDRCAWAILDGLGAVYDGNADVHRLPARLGALARLFHVYVAVAVAPHTWRYHAARGIEAAVTRRSLADVGRQVAKHHRRHGVAGVLTPSWVANILRGQLFQLGRLQFQPALLGGSTGRAIAAVGGPGGPGQPCLELHIPDFLGPLTPAACDRSVEQARAFFASVDDGRYPVATCHSWLLDRQLAALLPATSNIVAFQGRFAPGYAVTEPSDREPVDFVFDDPSLPLEQFPRDTTLRRVVVDHLRSGGHWYAANGWFHW